MGRRFAWVGIALGATYLIFIGGGWWGIYTSWLRLLTVLIAGLALATWLFVAIRQPAWRPRTLMWPAIVASLGSLAISTVLSNQPRVSIEYLAYAVVLTALYLLLVRLFADPFLRPRLVALLVMLFGAIAALYVGSVVVGWIEWWRLAGLTIPPLRPGFEGLTFGNPSAVLTILVLLAVPVAGAYGALSRRGAVVLAVVGLVIATVAAVSGSRAGWFALGVTAIVSLLVIAGVPAFRRPALAGVRSMLRDQPPVLWLPVVILMVEAAIVAPGVVQRVFSGGEPVRLSFAVAAIRMFMTSPLVGTGPGTWVIQRPGVIGAGEPDDYVPHAHNLEVQTLAELGLVGAIAGVVVLASIVRLLRLGVRADDPILRRWSWFAAAGLGYFFLHQLLDFYANMPAFLFAAAVPIAYLDATVERAAWHPPAALRRLGAAFAVGLVGVSLVGLVVQEIPALRHDAAVANLNNRAWGAATGPAREAAAMDPDIAPYQFTAGLAASANDDHGAAAEHFEHVVAHVDLPEAWLNLAAEQAELGDDTAARASIARALRLGENRPWIAIAAGDLAIRVGDESTGRSAFAAAVAASPSLAADAWWSMDGARQALYADVISKAIARSPVNAWEIELMAGQRMTSATPFAITVARAWNGDAAAVQALLGNCAEDPLNASVLAWCARVERHLGDADAAVAFTERVGLISLGAAQGTLEMRVTQDGAQGFELAPDLWATYTYRRPGPRDPLVGSLIHLHLE